MSKDKSYAGIDYFRFIAALLIIAIHTSPLAPFSEIGDFILTRIVARLAVPFFFMTSGFFLISRYTYDNRRLKKFLKRTAFIYAAAILIYLPVNIYNDYFSMDQLLPNMIKDLVFDGTMYHLWYLSASILGAVIAWHLVKKAGYPKALIVTGMLYLVGIFGDSYYGVLENAAGFNSFYQLIFQISDHTRNGIFFAPVFFVLGGCIADCKCRLSFGKSICVFIGSFLLMLAEGMLLHHYKLQRHDSMYVFLLPAVFGLFFMLLQFRGKRRAGLRNISLIVYVIHPMMIIVIRMAAKLLGLNALLVENSLIHYLAVSITSVVFGATVIFLWNRLPIKRGVHSADTERAWIEIELDNLKHNAAVLQKAMPPGCRMMAVVKDEAYGHSAFEVSVCLNKIGVKAFAVATIEEGIALRKYGIEGEILILGYTDAERAADLKKYCLTQTIIDFDYAKKLNRQKIPLKVHIKFDTGMHRLGIPCEDTVSIKRIFAMKNLTVSGIYTHLCCSDSLQPKDVLFTQNQIKDFYHCIDKLKEEGIDIPKLHIQSSYGLLNYPEIACDYVRVGIALYGVLSTPDDHTKQKLELRPVLSLKAKVVLIRKVPRGDSVGYGAGFTAIRDSRIAILPIGYGDGFPRSLSCGSGSVVIRGRCFPIVGRICMDQLAVDITEAEDISVGDIAVLIGMGAKRRLQKPDVAESRLKFSSPEHPEHKGQAARNPAEIFGGLPASEVAVCSGSISNELLSRMGTRLPVIVVENK